MKSSLIAKRYWKDKTTPMGEVAVLAQGVPDLINLSIGDPDLTTDPQVIEKALADALAGHTRYTDCRGDAELRTEIRKYYMEEYGMTVDDEEIFVTTGACIAMYLALEAILDDGDEVLLLGPYFTPYLQQIELARGVPVEVPTYEKDNYQIDNDRLQAATTERTKAIIINTPCNPTGSVISPKTMEALAEFAKKNDLIVLADDIYTAFSFGESFVPIASYPGMRERTVTINSCSKNFMMTGWRVGNIIAPKVIIDTILQINENLCYCVTSVSQRAAIHAMRERKRYQGALVEEYRKRMFYAAERINAIPRMSVLQPEGTFYLFPNIKETGLSSKEVSKIILQEARVLLIPGTAFGESGEGHLRLCCTKDVPTLKEAFDRIQQVSIFR